MVAEIHAPAPVPEDVSEVVATAGVLRLTTKKDDGAPQKEKRVPVFYIDDTMYTVPAEPGAEIGLKMLELLEHRGQEAAMYYMLTTMLGQDGYKALMTYKNLPPTAMAQVIKRINEIANGALEGPKAT